MSFTNNKLFHYLLALSVVLPQQEAVALTCNIGEGGMQAFWAADKAEDGRDIRIWKTVDLVKYDPVKETYYVKWHHTPNLCTNIVSGFWGENTPNYAQRAPECIKMAWELRKSNPSGTGSPIVCGALAGSEVWGNPEPAPKARTEGTAADGSRIADHTVLGSFTSDVGGSSGVDPVYIYAPILGLVVFVGVAVFLMKHKQKKSGTHTLHTTTPEDFHNFNWQAADKQVPQYAVPHIQDFATSMGHHTKVYPKANDDPSRSHTPSRSVTPRGHPPSRSRSVTPRAQGLVLPIANGNGHSNGNTQIASASPLNAGTPRSGSRSQGGNQTPPRSGRSGTSHKSGLPSNRNVSRGASQSITMAGMASQGIEQTSPRVSTTTTPAATPRGFGAPRSSRSGASNTPRSTVSKTTPRSTPSQRFERQGTIVYEKPSPGGDGGHVPRFGK